MSATPRQREAMRLRDEGLTRNQIARTLGVSKISVQRLLRQGDNRAWLAEHLPEALPTRDEL